MSESTQLKPGEHEETLYLEPRATFDACVLRLDEGVAIYDGDKVIQAFQMHYAAAMPNELYPDATREEEAWTMAQEWFDYNVAGAYLGKYTPKYEFKNFDEL